MKIDQALPLSKMMQVVGRPVTYYPSIALALGGSKVSIFISNFLYWEGHQADPEGFIYKSQKEITQETGLSRSETESSRKILKELNIMEEVKRGIPCRLHYRFNWDRLDEVMQRHFNGDPVVKKKTNSNIVQLFREIFDEVYIEETNGVSFEWGKGAGKEWKHLKNLSEVIEKRCRERREKVDPDFKGEIEDQEILDSWRAFLSMLPKYHKQMNLAPSSLYSNFSKIILQIKKNAKRAKKQVATNTTAAASDYM